MYLTIMRHGEAGRAASDRERALTARGREEVQRGCAVLRDTLQRRNLPAVSRLLHSAWLRTTQTAQYAQDTLAPTVFASSEALLPGARIGAIDRLMEPLLDRESHVLLVSHQPMVSTLADHYLGYGRVPGLNPGGWVCLQLEAAAAGCGILQCWSLPPAFEVQA